MRSNLIHTTRRFTCLAYGNGLAYALSHKLSGDSVLFQGDDADQFRTELDTLTNGRLPLSYDEALGVLWNDYHAAADPGVAAAAPPRRVRKPSLKLAK